jgi:hypothetical protein
MGGLVFLSPEEMIGSADGYELFRFREAGYELLEGREGGDIVLVATDEQCGFVRREQK